MANVCWWYFFSKIIEMADTVRLMKDINYVVCCYDNLSVIKQFLYLK